MWQSSKVIHEGHYLILDCPAASLLVSGDKPEVCMPEPIFSSVQTFAPVIANAVWQSSKIIHEGHYLILDCFVTSLLVSGDKPQVCIPDLALHAAQFN